MQERGCSERQDVTSLGTLAKLEPTVLATHAGSILRQLEDSREDSSPSLRQHGDRQGAVLKALEALARLQPAVLDKNAAIRKALDPTDLAAIAGFTPIHLAARHGVVSVVAVRPSQRTILQKSSFRFHFPSALNGLQTETETETKR